MKNKYQLQPYLIFNKHIVLDTDMRRVHGIGKNYKENIITVYYNTIKIITN